MIPNQTLPKNIIKLISEYSKPLTRPDWRTIQPVPFQTLYTDVIQRRNYKRRALQLLYNTIHNPHTIARILYHTTYYNIYISSIILNMSEIVLSGIAQYFQPFIDEDEEFIFKYRY